MCCPDKTTWTTRRSPCPRFDMRPIAIVGDIHGEADKLAPALEWIGRERLVIFVGDYVNRGRQSKQVLEMVSNFVMSRRSEVVLLRGNHDHSLLSFLEGGDFSTFATSGGLPTIAAYLGTDHIGRDLHQSMRKAVPRRHVELLESTRSHWEEDGLLVSHSGLNPRSPTSRTNANMYRLGHPNMFSIDWGPNPARVVCGHYVQRDAVPHISDRLICIDTGCGTVAGGLLTVLLLPECQTMQF